MALRRREVKHNALVAAATKVDLADRDRAKRQAARPAEWQAEAWAYFDEVPEVKESMWYLGNQLAKLRLFPAIANPDDPDGDPISVDDERAQVPEAVREVAKAELARLKSRLGGQSEIIRVLNMNLEVPGEAYLVGLGERTEQVKLADGTTRPTTVEEDWSIRSTSEVELKSGKWIVKDGPADTKGVDLDPDQDTIIRIWLRHPRWRGQPDSNMRALLGECKALTALSAQIVAEANSRQSAGAFTVPSELSFGPADPTSDEDGDEAEADPFMDELETALVTPIGDPTAAASVMPMLIRGPAEYLKPDVLRRIDFGREANEQLDRRIDARVQRLARGMNLPVEKVLGHQQTTFANARQIDQDEFDDYLAPRCEVIVDALTFAYLQPQLRESPSAEVAAWAEDIVIWYDPSRVIRKPDTEQAADAGHDRGTISDAAWRKARGFTQEDAPTEEELAARMARRRGIFTEALTVAMLMQYQELGLEPPVEWVGALAEAKAEATPDEEVPAGPPDDEAVAAAARRVARELIAGTPRALGRATPPRPLALPAAAAPTRPDYGRQLTDLDRDLRTRLLVASNDAMGRALERAGNRLRSQAGPDMRRTVLAHVPARGVASALRHAGGEAGARVLVAAADDALAGAWDELERQFMEWGGRAQGDAIDLAGRVAAGFTTSERQALALRQADNLAEAWAWMRGALDGLATERMFDPDPAVPDLGEFDPSLRVPPGLVRQAQARAGGATALITTEGGAWLALVDGGARPAGGIGTGELIREALRDHGAMVEAYRWTYGPALRQRPFQPHVDLDGTVFRNFDDDVLANYDGWPEFAFYMPGDHPGCVCDFEPIIVPADEVS